MTRDSPIWNWLFAFGLAAAAALIAGNAADYGLSDVQFRWLQLAASALIAAGKFGNSPLKGENDGR
jgi:hypothetical protein